MLLAAAVAARPGETVLDAGTGSGAAALCLAARVPGAAVIGLERDPELLELARANAAANAGSVAIVAGDLFDPAALAGHPPFDRVLSNPPYHPGSAATSPRTPTARAAHLAEQPISAWVEACLARLRPRGWLTVIHRAGALAELVAACAGRAGDVVVFPLWPTADAPEAKRVLLAARKGGRGPTRIARGLVLHEADGRYTEAAEAVLRGAAPLRLTDR